MVDRALARVAVVTGAACGVLVFTYQIGQHGPMGSSDEPASPSADPVVVAGPPRSAGVLDAPRALRADLTVRTASRTSVTGGPAPSVRGGTAEDPGVDPDRDATGRTGAGQPATVDESRPHRHVVDPETGGLVSVAGARGTVPAVGALGPVHVDPLPAGVSLSDPTDTASLLERAGARQAAVADAGQPITSGASAPIGTPGIGSLDEHVAPSCSGTGTDGSRVQVLYVHDADTPSRLDDVRTVLLDEVANVDDVFAVSSEQTGGGRRVRWVHDADCMPVIKDITVPAGSLGSDFWATVNAVKALGYKDAKRKYLMFADANQLCGIGTLYDDTRLSGNYNDGFAASYARVDAGCWSAGHSVAAHELTHTLGGVQSTAPHATSKGHCYDDSDIMCYDDGSGVAMRKVCPSAQEQLLDCNHDDYFSTAPAPGSYLATSWNTASSSFLDRVSSSGVPPPAGPTGTSPTSTTWSAPHVSGRQVSAQVLGAGSAAPVTFQVRWQGTTRWIDRSVLTTDGTGWVDGAASRARAGSYRFVLPPGEGYAESSSPSVRLRVVTRLSIARATRGRLVGVLRTAAGSRVGGTVVALQRRRSGSSAWVTLHRERTDGRGVARHRVHPRGAAYFRWTFRGTAVLRGDLSGRVRVHR